MPAQAGIFAFRHAELVEASLYLLFRFLAYARNDDTILAHELIRGLKYFAN